MKDTYALTKIIVGVIGIYFLIQFIIAIVGLLFMMINAFFLGGTMANAEVLLYLGMLLLWGFLLFWIFFYKRNRIVDWIVKDVPFETEAGGSVNRIYFGYRLVCVIAGLLLCYRFVITIHSVLMRLRMYLDGGAESGFSHLLQSFGVLLLLPAGIYLLCGAPHFVHWQVTKTLALCKETAYAEKEEKPEP